MCVQAPQVQDGTVQDLPLYRPVPLRASLPLHPQCGGKQGQPPLQPTDEQVQPPFQLFFLKKTL